MRDYNINLDIQVEENVKEDIWFMRGDTGNSIALNLIDNGEVVNLDGYKVVAFFENKNKVVSQKDLEIVDSVNGKVRIDVTTSIIDVVGSIKVVVKIYDSVGVVNSFMPFNIISKANISTDDSIIASSEIDVIKTIIDSNEKITRLNEELDKTLGIVGDEILGLKDEVEASLVSFKEVINKNLGELDSKLVGEMNTLSETFGNALVQINNMMEESVQSIGEHIGLEVEKINTSINNLQSNVNRNLELLDDKKIDVIVSEEEPNIIGLKAGTVWIRPIIVE